MSKQGEFVEKSKFKSHWCYLLPLCAWGNQHHLPSFSFFICKMGIMRLPWGLSWGENLLTHKWCGESSETLLLLIEMIQLSNFSSASNQGIEDLYNKHGSRAKIIVNCVSTFKWLRYSVLKWQRPWWIVALNFCCAFIWFGYRYCESALLYGTKYCFVSWHFAVYKSWSSSPPFEIFLQQRGNGGSEEERTYWAGELVSESRLRIWGRTILANGKASTKALWLTLACSE